MNQEMLAAARELGVRAEVTFPTGSTVTLDGAEVLGFSVEEGADSALLPGCVLSAQMTLELRNDAGQWRYGGGLRGARPLVGATVKLFVAAGEKELPCSVFVVSRVQAVERSGRVRLSGSDSIPGELSGRFSDGLTYPATLQAVWEHLAAQTRYEWSGVLPNGAAVIPAAPDWGECSLRRAAGWIAQAAGCFVRVDREGALEVVPCMGGAAEALDGGVYMRMENGFESYGPVRGIRIEPVDGEAFEVSDGDGERVSVSGNPLFGADCEELADGMLAQLSGLTLSRAEFRWRGDPAVGVGTRIALTDTLGDVIECTVTRQTLRMDGGFSATCSCEVPTLGDGGVMRAITPEGGVNAGALVGTVDGGLLAAGSVVARSIAAGAVTAEKMAAGAVTAEKIAAGAVDAQSIEAITGKFQEIAAQKLTVDELYAALAEIAALQVGSITADSIEADRLAAVMGDFVKLYAEFAGVDFATVKDLNADQFIFREGTAGEVYIDRLAVTSANIVSAMLGELVVKGDDGGYYRLHVGADGTVSTEEVMVTDGEIAAGQTAGGCGIVETSLNVRDLNAQSIRGASAIIAEIFTDALTAGKITAGQAMIASARVPELYTTAIKALGENIDISANTAIKLLIETNDLIRAWYAFTEDGMQMGKAGSTYSTLVDETGFHVLQLGGKIGSFAKRQLETEAVRIGRVGSAGKRMVMREAADGGIAFVLEGAT